MPSPAQMHRQRRAAAAEAAARAADAPRADTTQLDLMLAQLGEHKRELHDIQSIERKIDRKREIVGDYAPYLAGVLEANKGGEDPVVTTLMVWRFDIGDIQGGLQLAEYVLDFGLEMSDSYKRTPACIVAEEVAEAALRKLPEGEPNPVSLDQLNDTLVLTDDYDMPDEVRAKLHKALGNAQAAAEQWPEAVDSYTRALQLNDKAGVKKDLEKAQRAAKAQADS